jgi:transposase
MKNSKAATQEGKARPAQKEVRVAPAKKEASADSKNSKEVVAELIRRLNELVGLSAQQAEQDGEGEEQAGTEHGPKRWEMNLTRLTIGVDLGDKKSNFCIMTPAGKVVTEGKVDTEREAIRELFEPMASSRVVIEVGSHSAWVEEVLEECGHEVMVANGRKMEGKRQRKKNDKEDARMLAGKGRADPDSLYPIEQRGKEVREGLTLIRLRKALVEVRTKLINAIRGIVKSHGSRVGKCSSEAFVRRCEEEMPEWLADLAEPLVDVLGAVNEAIRAYDQAAEKLAAEKYAQETERMKQIKGVGTLTALSFVLTIGDPKRFGKSREVGPYLGLVPRQQDSGEIKPQLGITKAGDEAMRSLLVGSAHYILGPFGEDSDIRRHGLKMSESGGKSGKKRAVVAVARRLAVLMHRLWVSGEDYEPLRNARLNEARQNAARQDAA